MDIAYLQYKYKFKYTCYEYITKEVAKS